MHSPAVSLRLRVDPFKDQPDRNPDGTFTKGSELAKELGSKGGHVAHEHAIEKDGVSSLPIYLCPQSN